MTEQELLENGYEKEMLCFNIQEYDPQLITDNKFRRLSYDLDRTFTSDQISVIKRFCDEVNKRFPNIKMFLSGTGFVKKEDNGESVQDKTLESSEEGTKEC